MIVDRHRFSLIVQEYSQPLYWHIRRLVVSHDDAEDILQETLVKAYRHLWTLQNPSSLRAWLYRIATNEANRFLSRRVKSEEMSEVLVGKLFASEYVNYEMDAEVKLQKAILSLPAQQRTVFCLKYYDEMDYDEISKITGSKPETLKVSYHYAKEKVKKFLEG